MFVRGALMGACAAAAVAAAAALPAPAAARSLFLSQPDRIAVDGAARQDVAVLDFNGDGWPDIALAGGRVVELVLGRADGWDPMQSITLSGGDSFGPSRIAGADLTGDGRDDIVVAVPGLGVVAVLRGRQDGVLTAPPTADIHAVAAADGSVVPFPTMAIDIGDLDANGSPDVVAMHRPPNGFTGQVVALVNDGQGALTASTPITLDTPMDVQLVRLGGDSDPDLVVAQGTGAGPPMPGTPEGEMSLLAGGAGASFAGPAPIVTTGSAMTVAAGDVDGDGTPDVIAGVSGQGVPGPQLLAGSPTSAALATPRFVLAQPLLPLGATVEAGDVDRDGRVDVAVDSDDGRGVRMLTSAPGGGSRLETGAYIFPEVALAWTVADADGDGKLDLIMITTELGGSPLRVYYGLGPLIAAPAPYVDFGDVLVGAASAPAGGTFVNQGPGTASSLIVLVDGDVGDFALVQDGCSGATLQEGAGCTMAASFRPQAAGPRELDAAVVAPDSDEASWIALFGTGKAPAGPPPAPVGAASLRPSALALSARLTHRRAARLTGRGTKLRFASGWRATCPAPGPSCRVTLLLVAKAKPGHRAPVLARLELRLKPGVVRDLVAPVTSAGRRALSGGHAVRALLRVQAQRSGAQTAVVQRNVTVRLRRSHQPRVGARALTR